MLECRLCLQIGPSVFVFDELKCLPEKIWDCCGITIVQNDGLPTQICFSCELRLNTFIEFRQTCIRNDMMLKERCKQNVESNLPTEFYDRSDVSNSSEMLQDVDEKDTIKKILSPRESDAVWLKCFSNTSKAENELCKYNCKECGKHMSSLSSLKNHTKRMHKNLQKTLENINKPILIKREIDNEQFTDTTIPLAPENSIVKCEEIEIEINDNIKREDYNEFNSAFKMAIDESSECFLKKINLPTRNSLRNDRVSLKPLISTEYTSSNQKGTMSGLNCNICKKIFKSERTLNNHIREIHQNKPRKTFECNVCNKFFFSKRPLEIHLKRHMNMSKKWQCDKCDHSTEYKYRLDLHIKRKHSKNTVDCQCNICGKILQTKYMRDRHIKQIHEKKYKTYECDMCYKTFKSKGNISEHIKRHMNLMKKFPCDRCDFKGDSHSKLRQHIEGKHLNLRKYQCSICGKLFNLRSTCQTHAKIHENFFPFQCDYCGKGFKHKSSFTMHILIHMGIKRHMCTYCSKRFSDSSTLKTHILQHTGENPFSCDLCQKGFKQRSNLKSHMKHFHKQYSID